MQVGPVANPNRKLTAGFGITTILGLVGGFAGIAMDSDMGIGIGILCFILALTGAITTPILWFSGRKQVKEMTALLAGQGLRVHWTFDQDEWSRYTANEYARGMKETRTVAIWTFTGLFGLFVVIDFFSGEVSALTVLLGLGLGLAFAALLGGIGYLVTKATHARNLKGAGEVFIGETSIYFGTKFYTWSGVLADLSEVKFDPGDPSVVHFQIHYGTGNTSNYVDVRVPVPRGREDEAQALVESY